MDGLLTTQLVVHSPDGENHEGQEEKRRQVPINKVPHFVTEDVPEVAGCMAGWAFVGGRGGNADDEIAGIREVGVVYSITGGRHCDGV